MSGGEGLSMGVSHLTTFKRTGNKIAEKNKPEKRRLCDRGSESELMILEKDFGGGQEWKPE